jgi:hypothetical protein
VRHERGTGTSARLAALHARGLAAEALKESPPNSDLVKIRQRARCAIQLRDTSVRINSPAKSCRPIAAPTSHSVSPTPAAETGWAQRPPVLLQGVCADKIVQQTYLCLDVARYRLPADPASAWVESREPGEL